MTFAGIDSCLNLSQNKTHGDSATWSMPQQFDSLWKNNFDSKSFLRNCMHQFKKLKYFKVLGWKNSFKVCASGSVAILSTATEMTAADLARACVAAGRNMAALLRRHDKFEVVPLGENL